MSSAVQMTLVTSRPHKGLASADFQGVRGHSPRSWEGGANMKPYEGVRAIVVGGSIGGLTTGLLLQDLGFTVDIFERTPNPLSGRGSGIVLQPETIRWFRERGTRSLDELGTTTRWVQYLDTKNRVINREERSWSYTAWGTFYRALLEDFGEPRYHLGEFAVGFEQDADGVTVRFISGAEARAELVVFADGVTSVTRLRLDPEAKLRYSGYVGWRGTVPESSLSDQTRGLLSDAVTYNVIPHSHILLYPIPGDGGVGQDRLMNYVWYRNVPDGADLAELLIDKRGIPGIVSVHPGQVQDRYVEELRDTAVSMLAPAAAEVVSSTVDPYLQVVSDVRAERMADGRVALIGDAACAARPHAAAGTAKAAADGWALWSALKDAQGDIPAALLKWEPGQLALSANLLKRVIEMGERSQLYSNWDADDPQLRFGLYAAAADPEKESKMTENWLNDLPLAGTVVGTNFDTWTPQLRAEFDTHAFDGEVGSRLLSENDRVRVWEIRLGPDERWHVHRHVLDYFWTAVTPGRSRQHTSDGTTREVSYAAGETRHFAFGPGQFLLHDIENVGESELIFTTVEHLDSQNPPLPI